MSPLPVNDKLFPHQQCMSSHWWTAWSTQGIGRLLTFLPTWRTLHDPSWWSVLSFPWLLIDWSIFLMFNYHSAFLVCEMLFPCILPISLLGFSYWFTGVIILKQSFKSYICCNVFSQLMTCFLTFLMITFFECKF